MIKELQCEAVSGWPGPTTLEETRTRESRDVRLLAVFGGVAELLNAPSEETNLVNTGLVSTEIHPSFQDALAYWRRHLWRSAIFSKTDKDAALTENISLAIDTLAYAA